MIPGLTSSVASSAPVSGFHTMTVLSLDAEASRALSGLHAHIHTMSV
jgi:hypothetical protein